MTEEPDTTEAAAEAIARVANVAFVGKKQTAYALAAITADRKALAEAGYTIAPAAKISEPITDIAPSEMDQSHAIAWIEGYSAAVEYLQSLGLPIELEDE